MKHRKTLLKIDAILLHFACNIVNPALVLQISHISGGRKRKQYLLVELHIGKYIRIIKTSICTYNALTPTNYCQKQEISATLNSICQEKIDVFATLKAYICFSKKLKRLMEQCKAAFHTIFGANLCATLSLLIYRFSMVLKLFINNGIHITKAIRFIFQSFIWCLFEIRQPRISLSLKGSVILIVSTLVFKAVHVNLYDCFL